MMWSKIFEIKGKNIFTIFEPYQIFFRIKEMRETDNKEFSEGLKLFKNRLSLNNKELSNICGVSVPLVYNWENCQSLPTYQTLQKLHSFGMRDYEMFGGAVSSGKNECADISELSQILNAEIEKLHLIECGNGTQKIFNDLPNKEKIAFLCKIVRSHLEFLDSVNDFIIELSKNQENK